MPVLRRTSRLLESQQCHLPFSKEDGLSFQVPPPEGGMKATEEVGSVDNDLKKLD